MHDVWIGLGSNTGDRRAHLAAALRALADMGDIRGVSSVFESDPVGFTEQPPFWNLVVRLHTPLSPDRLLHALQQTEQRLGRRPTFRYGPRTIDLDLLLYDRLCIEYQELQVPHPRMLERAFVLRPLVQLDPDLRHPITGERFAEHLERAQLERAVPLFPGDELLRAAPASDADTS